MSYDDWLTDDTPIYDQKCPHGVSTGRCCDECSQTENDCSQLANSEREASDG